VEILNKADEGTAVYGVTKFMDYSRKPYFPAAIRALLLCGILLLAAN